MADNTEFRRRLFQSLAKVHRRAETDFKLLRRSLEMNIEALKSKAEALESKAEALESKTRVLEAQNVLLERQIGKHVQEYTEQRQQALTDLMARSLKENNQSFAQRLASLEKQLPATARIESSDNAGTTKLRTKRRRSELRNPQAKQRKYSNNNNNNNNNNIELGSSLHGTFRMVLRSQTKTK